MIISFHQQGNVLNKNGISNNIEREYQEINTCHGNSKKVTLKYNNDNT